MKLYLLIGFLWALRNIQGGRPWNIQKVFALKWHFHCQSWGTPRGRRTGSFRKWGQGPSCRSRSWGFRFCLGCGFSNELVSSIINFYIPKLCHLTAFSWEASMNPQTHGTWISRPHVWESTLGVVYGGDRYRILCVRSSISTSHQEKREDSIHIPLVH